MVTASPSASVQRTWTRFGIALVLLLVLGVLVSRSEWRAPLLKIIGIGQAAMTTHPVAGALLFVLLSACSLMLAFFSSAVLVPAAVATYGTWGTFALLWGGWVVGGSAAYGVGRWLGRPIIRRLTSAALLARYEARITTKAPWGLVFLLQLALPSEIPGYLVGLIQWGYWRYLPALALAELPYAIGTVFLGGELLQGHTLPLMLAGVAVLTLSIVAYEVLHRQLNVSHA